MASANGLTHQLERLRRVRFLEEEHAGGEAQRLTLDAALHVLDESVTFHGRREARTCGWITQLDGHESSAHDDRVAHSPQKPRKRPSVT